MPFINYYQACRFSLSHSLLLFRAGHCYLSNLAEDIFDDHLGPCITQFLRDGILSAVPLWLS